jgi:hypothetical protein
MAVLFGHSQFGCFQFRAVHTEGQNDVNTSLRLDGCELLGRLGCETAYTVRRTESTIALRSCLGLRSDPGDQASSMHAPSDRGSTYTPIKNVYFSVKEVRSLTLKACSKE